MNNTSQSQVSFSDPVPLEEAGTGREVADKVGEGRAVIEVVSTPWGLEFYVREVVRER